MALLVRLDSTVLAQHSFLDQRVLTRTTTGAWIPWSSLAAAAAPLPAGKPCYIFHIGHCGSTLLSRLVSAATGAAALREPLVLRALAWDAAEGDNAYLCAATRRTRLAVFDRLFARGPAPVVVKATSVATSLIAEAAPGAGKIFVWQRAPTHLPLILAGPNSVADLKGFAPMRRKRLVRFAPGVGPLFSLSIGELAALTWLCETAEALSAVEQGTACAVDFDAFLATPIEGLAGACAALGLPVSVEACEAAVGSPIMSSYSKAPEQSYSPEIRLETIAAAHRQHRDEIQNGLRWLERTASQHPLLTAALDRFG